MCDVGYGIKDSFSRRLNMITAEPVKQFVKEKCEGEVVRMSMNKNMSHKCLVSL